MKTRQLKPALIHSERIASRIFLFRDRKVMLDSDLAPLYHVTTKAWNQQVKRNSDRFPEDFAFQLSQDAWRRHPRRKPGTEASSWH